MQGSDELEQIDGQRAVGKELGVEWAVRAESLGQALGPAQVNGDKVDLPLVGMEPMATVPIQAVEAQGRTAGQDERQEQETPNVLAACEPCRPPTSQVPRRNPQISLL